MAEQIAERGGRTPIFIPLNQYTGQLLTDIGRSINDADPLSADFVKDLLSTGAFTIMLDGLNEVQQSNLQSKIREELSSLSDPKSKTARSQWIVSGRKYDYAFSRKLIGLEFLEINTWEIQPLSPDLIYQYLKDGLEGGEVEAIQVYHDLDINVMDICTNPLMLNMFFAVYTKTKTIPAGRGKLYGQFIELLLNWGSEKGLETAMTQLSGALGYKIAEAKYFDLLKSSLTDLAKNMEGTSIAWDDTQSVLAQSLRSANNSQKAAEIVRKDLLSRGLLKMQSRRISFYHHTFQEYFQALGLKGIPVDSLIPASGVSGERREQIVFLAGIVENLANPMLSRAINMDVGLAYDIYRNSVVPIERQNLLKLAKYMWDNTLVQDGGLIGGRRPFALRFESVAKSLNLSIPELTKELFPSKQQQDVSKDLLRFYQQLGDLEKQKQIINDIGTNEETPDDLLFEMAVTAHNEGKHQLVVDLYTKYIKTNSYQSAAYSNRAAAYWSLGKTDEAKIDYKKAIELNPNNSNMRTNYARLLKQLQDIDEAKQQLREAVKDDDNAMAQYEYGLLLEVKNPDEAFVFFEKAAKVDADRDNQEKYLQKLVGYQVKHDQLSQAIRSYKQLIKLNPTSYHVKKWKETIADLRLKIDALEKRRSTRDKLREKEDVIFGVMVKDFLSAAGLNVNIIAPQLYISDGSKARLPSQLAVALLDTPQLNASLVRDAVDAVSKHLPYVNDVVLITTVDTLDFESRMQLLSYRSSEKRISLITSLEAQETFLRGDDACVELIDRSLRRAIDVNDPFDNRVPIKDRTDFFGRDAETQTIRGLIRDQQPIGIYGIHKIGKSSLLNRVRQSLAAYSPDITIVSIELSLAFNSASSVYRRILESLPQEIDVPRGDIGTEMFRQKMIDYQKHMQAIRPGHRLLFIFDECAYLIPDSSGKGGILNFLEFLGFLKSFRQETDWFNFLLCGRTPAITDI